ncbi:MAG: TlpA disulfide reductase family protein [Mariprofundaceae bacterium]|nr:TlpA disulfide reductase family protein [Mariprofundaceae bacterium]
MAVISSVHAVDFKWMNDKGEVHSLSQDYQQQPVLIHVWASWCGPCRAEMPDMAAWLKKHPEVKFVPVSLDSDLATAQDFLTSQGIDLPALLTDQQQAGYLGIRGLPTTILVNQQGQMIDRRIGMQDWRYPAWSNEILALFASQKAFK